MSNKSADYINLQVKKWRALTYDWNILSSYGNTSRAYCLTDFQAAWLLSNTDYMQWSQRWENCPCTDEDLSNMKAELEYNLMSCIDLQPYQLQSLYDAQMSDQLDYLQSVWDIDPTPSAINPSTPDDYYNGDDSQERIDALCTACKIYVYSYAQNWVVKAQTVLGIVAVVGLFASISIVGGVIASVLVGGLAYITSLALDAMQDENALDDIACCMNSTLSGLAITQANFETCLDGCSFGVGTNAEIARSIIASDIGAFKNWLSFINALGDAYDLAQIGIKDCPCEGEWEETFDFTIGDGDFVIWSPPANANVFGVYDSGIGWNDTDHIWTSSPTQYRRAVAIKREWSPSTTIREISMTFDLTKGTYSSAVTAITATMQLNGVNQASVSVSSNVATNGTDKVQVLTSTVTANGILFHVSTSARTSALYNGSTLIKSVTVKGTGYNPF